MASGPVDVILVCRMPLSFTLNVTSQRFCLHSISYTVTFVLFYTILPSERDHVNKSLIAFSVKVTLQKKENKLERPEREGLTTINDLADWRHETYS